MKGKIIKGIAGFYYVHTASGGMYECKAKGIFREKSIKPLVGDVVDIEILDEEKRLGNITSINERRNVLVRPAVANIDQALVIFAITKPTPNLNLLDKLLISMARQNVECIICFNKCDISDEKEAEELKKMYSMAGFAVLITSTYSKEGTKELELRLKGKTTVLAGPSGVGKSSMVNLINPECNMETGGLSKKIDRGKHTTRHSELFCIDEDTFICDTPGFTSLYLEGLEKQELKAYFPEFRKFNESCRFAGCVHINEPDCSVKEAVSTGAIHPERYESYVKIYEELESNRRKY